MYGVGPKCSCPVLPSIDVIWKFSQAAFSMYTVKDEIFVGNLVLTYWKEEVVALLRPSTAAIA